ncbi:hypothetical protein BA190_26855 [Labrys sp. WJW]|uniref:hypothetical protein n=1 Tax=Labrys sp. WJW TaxID=1737983 RepID=UPI00082AC753|nr:hypothetical protein [Labrys sp. WJW]OCC01835.1 hypothetical protein BA190_26855 [Labrys sp. WJW]
MSSMFGGGAEKAAKRQERMQANQNRIALARSQQDAQGREQETATNMAALAKAPRGRRLLMGDTGGSSTIGGGA